MEFEKKALEKTLEEKITWGEDGWKKYKDVSEMLVRTEEECARLRRQAERQAHLEAECATLSAALDEERKKREEAERELDAVLSTPTPQAFDLSKFRTPPVSRTMIFAKRGGLGFRSDSTSSSTDEPPAMSWFWSSCNKRSLPPSRLANEIQNWLHKPHQT